MFSLVTLLLLTLLSANMIQQNRLEFMMASNAQTQTETFSVAEDILKVTENYVETTLRDYNRQECSFVECRNPGGVQVNCSIPGQPMTAHYECRGSNAEPFDTPVGGWDLDPPTSGAIPETLYRCYTTGGKFIQLQASDVGYSSPPPWDVTDQLGLDTAKTGATEIKIASVACITDVGTEGICQYDDNGALIGSDYCASNNPNQCKTELYTLQVYSKTDSTSAQRIAESKFAVRCDADIDISAKP